jgi:uncharacterized protein
MTRAGRVVAIMAKAPIAGQAKTRLIPRLGAEHAARLYQHMLLDTIELVAQALNGSAAITIVCPTGTDRAALQQIVAPKIQVVADETGTLMGGLDYGLTYHVRQGYEQVILLDGDSPTLPAEHLQSAFEALDSADVVLGPTTDGGYYLIAACQAQSALFKWEHLDSATVCTQTQSRAEADGLRVELLPAWFDVDTSEDLDRLVENLRSYAVGAPRTRTFLERYGYL